MVALNRFKSLLILFVASTGSISASAQQIQPRIDGLQTDSVYMHLLSEDNRLTIKEDSITLVVDSLREIYRANPDGSTDSRQQIISFENELFELRAKKAMVVDSLNLIEQNWVLNNMESIKPIESEQAVLISSTSDDEYKYIYESPNVKANLSDVDYNNLIKAEELEIKVEELSNSYIVNYENMLSLSRSYEVTPLQSDAVEIRQTFDSLAMANSKILDRLTDSWGYIYDNKSFAYSMLMELLGFNDVLQQEAELMRAAQAEISDKSVAGDINELLVYLLQKSSMVEFERVVAQKLALTNLANSLQGTSQRLAAVEKRSLPRVSITERLFIAYEPIEFVTKQVYTTSNPIPQTVFYEKGTIFRLFVGSFSAKQQASIFRNTTPLSYNIDESKRYCYYIGGFETYEQAEEGFALLKQRGFRAPQIVVWCDGRERNLTKEPLPISSSYRLEIADTTALPDSTTECVAEIAPGSSISKVGTDKFVIMSLQRQGQADSLAERLRSLDPNLKISVEKSETKIEF